MNKTDANILKRGLRHMGIALLTTAMFVIAVAGFILTAIAPGYVAVILFAMSLVILAIAFVMLYAQGIPAGAYAESKGDEK